MHTITPLQFPLEELDLKPYVAGPQKAEDLIYDCYAISNHMGSCNAGHYTVKYTVQNIP